MTSISQVIPPKEECIVWTGCRTAKTAELEAQQKAHDRMLELAEIGSDGNVLPFRRKASS